EKVTLSLGVPTVWLGLLQYLEQTGKRIDGVDRVTVGGSAAPAAMIQAFEEKYGVRCIQGWGMTEMSPVGTLAVLKSKFLDRPRSEQLARQASQGIALYGVDMKVVAPDGKVQPHDGKSSGELLVRGPWIVSGYFNDEAASAAAFDNEGWFRTGDVSTIDEEGYMQIVDRSKDVIKSGGEWISSIDVENAAMGHPDVAEAAVIGDIGMAHRRVLDVDRADPFAAGLDDVLAAVDDLHIALLVDRRDVAGAEPALVVEGRRARRLIVEIAADDPRAAHQQLAARLAVTRLHLAVGRHHLHVDAVERDALARLAGELLGSGAVEELALEHRKRADRAHLGHAPALDAAHAVFLLEGLDHRRRRGRAADGDAVNAVDALAGLLEILQEAEPHRRHAQGQRHLLGLEQLVEAGAVELGAGKHQLGARHRRGIGDAPG